MKIRSVVFSKLPVFIATACFSLALPLAGCSGKSAAPDAATGSSVQNGAGPSSATGGSPSAGRRRMAQALMGLGLTDDQKQQIRAIMRSARKQSLNADPATRRANYKAAFAKIDTLLTPDQRVKLHARLGTMRNQGGQNAPAQS